MDSPINAIKIHPKDNVVVVTKNIDVNTPLVYIGGEDVEQLVQERVPFGHKVAITAIPEDGEVIKYGECMGIATESIEPGYHVHVSRVRGVTV